MRRALLLCLLACSDRPTAPRLPEAFIVVDTNVGVPSTASRLRIDLYKEDGVWFDTRDVALPDPRDWPTSFSVYSDDESREGVVLVRLRAYPEGHLRDYRGERRLDWDAPFMVVPGDDQPRLSKDGKDGTPAQEPDPFVTIDRLVRAHLRAGARTKIEVLLHGECAGTMPDLTNATSCVATGKEREPIADLPEGDDTSLPPSKVGTWLAEPCGDPPVPDVVCVQGGSAIIGDPDQPPVPPNAIARPTIPLRTYGVTSFWMDRTEVTVARVRKAFAEGLRGEKPEANDGPIGKPADIGDVVGCTWTDSPMDREDNPVSCWSWAASRAFCKQMGGDLPTEVQWEYAATMAGRPQKTRFPWGNLDGTCERAVHSRAIPGGAKSPCDSLPLGPDTVTSHPDDATPSGILGLGGGVSEWVRDTYLDYTSRCWANASIVDPVCEATGDNHSVRGSSWMSPLSPSSYRFGFTAVVQVVLGGVRCVYEVSR